MRYDVPATRFPAPPSLEGALRETDFRVQERLPVICRLLPRGRNVLRPVIEQVEAAVHFVLRGGLTRPRGSRRLSQGRPRQDKGTGPCAHSETGGGKALQGRRAVGRGEPLSGRAQTGSGRGAGASDADSRLAGGARLDCSTPHPALVASSVAGTGSSDGAATLGPAMLRGARPVQDVGISAIEIYFPKNVVSQSDLEKFDSCSTGKYTVGLGQLQMGFCADNEDVVSISLTVTAALLRNYNIDPSSIGFLAVGTETLIDKSKSVKTELMRLFGDNSDIEGVDVKNACFGGTQAVFHAIDWVHANYSTEKRHAIAVLADIAVYERGPARPTGGAGAIAVLITPDAPIPFDHGLRATFMTGSWDFYKPIGGRSTEYPTVDGPVSLQSYMNALDSCYTRYKEKALRISGEDISLSAFSAAMFHSPFTRMVEKAVARLAFRDFESGRSDQNRLYEGLGALSVSSFEDREVMRSLLSASELIWKQKTSPFLELNRRIGNMYTPSLFAQLVAFLASGAVEDSSRILFFAYGSGSASAMFSAHISDRDDSRFCRMQKVCRCAIARLDDRRQCTPEAYSKTMEMREVLLACDVPAKPQAVSSELTLFPGTYYLTLLDEKYRRSYSLIPYNTDLQGHTNGITNGINGDGDM